MNFINLSASVVVVVIVSIIIIGNAFWRCAGV